VFEVYQEKESFSEKSTVKKGKNEGPLPQSKNPIRDSTLPDRGGGEKSTAVDWRKAKDKKKKGKNRVGA